MVQFRSLIVQAYAKVDFREVYKIMQSGPKDIERFIDSIGTYCRL